MPPVRFPGCAGVDDPSVQEERDGYGPIDDGN